MNANNKVIDDIKRSIRLSDYIGQFTLQPPKKSGGDGKFLALCPLHDNTKSPAMSINDAKGVWKCFAGCGGGSIFDFWLIQNSYDPHDRGNFGLAVEALAKELGIELPEYKSDKKEISTTRIKKVLGQISDLSVDYLLDSSDEEADVAYKYLTDRGITDRLIEKYRIGFLPESSKAASKMMKKAAGDEYGVKAAIAGGALHVSDDGEYYTSLYGRILIPITDRYGNVLGFGAREVPGVKHYGEGKWINPTSTPVYDKSKVLFDGGELARNRNPKSVVVCEGYLDAIAVTESESDAIGMAVCGTATMPGHLDLLNNIENVTFMFDGDDAGMSATSKLTWAVNKRQDLFAVVLKGGLDPFDIVFGDDKTTTISDLISSAKPLLGVAVDVSKELNESNDKFDRWVANALSAIDSEQDKNAFAELAAKKRGLSKSSYIRNISRINIKSVNYTDDEPVETKVDANSAALIAFVLNLNDDEKDALFYDLPDDYIVDVCKNWLKIDSGIALATFTSALFGEPIGDEDVSRIDIDREISALMGNEDVDISRSLKAVFALLSNYSKTILAGGVSELTMERFIHLRDLSNLISIRESQKDVLSLLIDLSVDVIDWLDKNG